VRFFGFKKEWKISQSLSENPGLLLKNLNAFSNLFGERNKSFYAPTNGC